MPCDEYANGGSPIRPSDLGEKPDPCIHCGSEFVRTSLLEWHCPECLSSRRHEVVAYGIGGRIAAVERHPISTFAMSWGDDGCKPIKRGSREHEDAAKFAQEMIDKRKEKP